MYIVFLDGNKIPLSIIAQRDGSHKKKQSASDCLMRLKLRFTVQNVSISFSAPCT